MKSLYHFLIWCVAKLYRYMKRKLLFFSSIMSLCLIILLISFKWGLMCSNLQSHIHVKNICFKYQSGLSVGNLCEALCDESSISSVSCHNLHMGKEAVFTAKQGNASLVFKSPKKSNADHEVLYWLDNDKKIYPSESDFSNMIKTSIRLNFNIVINNVDAQRMSYTHFAHRTLFREIEMENVWNLLQDNEYLALLLYEKFDIFPKLVGSCGSLYAVQKLTTLSRYGHLIYNSKDEWTRRVKISILILNFLAKLENSLPEPLHICDVKMDHFGITNDFKKVKYLDLDSVHPLSITNSLTGDGSSCKDHSDCDIFDCRSFCNLITNKCQHGVANNNLQIVCEKIFLGWVMSGKLMVPGLLVGSRAPPVLIDLLEHCANPASESGTPRSPASIDIRERLHKLLTHLTWS